MKLRLAIIDDEYFIRQRLKKIIPWEALGLEFAGEGENGRDVLQLLEENPPDILMLDIRMPKMDGLETAQYIHDVQPQIIWNDLLDFFQKRLPPEIFLNTFQETESVWIIILLSGKKDSLYAIDTILPHFFPRKNSFCFLAVGTVFSLDRSWHAPYLQTVHGLNMRYFQKKTFMLLEESEGYSSEEQQSEINVRSGLTKLRQKLVLLINTRNEAEFTAFINEMFDNIQKKQDIRELHLFLSEFYITCQIHFPQGFENEDTMGSLATEQIAEEYSLETLKIAALSYGMRCMNIASLVPSDVSLSHRIRTYIQQHYQEPELSVHRLAEIFQLNPSYMGMLFKKVSHQSILQYLIQIRMEAAAKLITDGQYRITDIAQMVGYTDVFYFSKRFKKTYGVPPKEFIGRKGT